MSLAGFLAAFGGGVLGASIGAVPAFIFVGFIGLIGVAVLAAGGGTAILDHVAFGLWAPSAGGFAAGVAAAAYAKTKGKLRRATTFSRLSSVSGLLMHWSSVASLASWAM